MSASARSNRNDNETSVSVLDKSPTGGPLAGLKVLDFTHVFAGPFCTRTLADLGADVVHVESRQRDPGDRHRSAYAHRNKRSVSLDLKNKAGHAVAVRMAKVADIIVENFSAGVMRRLKLDYDTLSVVNPRLIFVALSGYGHTGPRSSWTSMNMNLQAYTGLMLTTGSEGDQPTCISNSWNDYIGGIHGVMAVLHALAERIDTGRGRMLDMSQFECSVSTLGPLLMASAISGKASKRMGNRSTNAAPQGVYRCAGDDEWIAISVQTDAQWKTLVKVIGKPALAQDARLASTVGRMRLHDELDAVIGAWTRDQTKEDVEAQLQQAGVPAERMRRAQDVINSSDAGKVYLPVPGSKALAATCPFSFGKTSLAAITPPSLLGEHTRAALRDWLCMNDAEIDALDKARALI